jgi:hypothetical protein
MLEGLAVREKEVFLGRREQLRVCGRRRELAAAGGGGWLMWRPIYGEMKGKFS